MEKHYGLISLFHTYLLIAFLIFWLHFKLIVKDVKNKVVLEKKRLKKKLEIALQQRHNGFLLGRCKIKEQTI
jgi:hypothetical protein